MNIGKTIAELRKANNMTQSEVADILGVSYQAVSKWERNESLPDITLLPQIADLFHVTIDQLLRGQIEINQEVSMNTNEISNINNDSLSNDITQLVNHEFENGNPSSNELADSISNFVENVINNSFSNVFNRLNKKKSTKKNINSLDDESISIILNNIDEIDEECFEMLIKIASNASNQIKGIIVDKLCKSDLDGLEISEIIVYLNNEQISKLITYCIDNNYIDIDDLMECLPFLSEKHLEYILNYLLENDEIEDYLDEMMPFLNDDQISNFLLSNIEYIEFDTIVDCAPFINDETLHNIIVKLIQNDEDIDLEDLYQFISIETKKELLKYYSLNNMFDRISDLTDLM